MLERRLDVEQIDHRRDDGDDARVDRGRRPRRPAALRRAGDDEAAHLAAAAGGGRGERGHGVHRAHGALRHRQACRPAVVAGAEELVPGVGDEVVLGPRLARGIVLEDDRLVRHHAQLRDHRAGIARGIDEPRRRGRRRVAIVAAAADEEEPDVARHLLRRDDDEPVLPQRLLDLLLRQPALRREIDQRRRCPFGRQRASTPSTRSWDRAPRRTGRARFPTRAPCDAAACPAAAARTDPTGRPTRPGEPADEGRSEERREEVASCGADYTAQ